jgi:death-on-curing protein
VAAIHADQIERYGGDLGLRDRGLLGSAVHAARNVAAYVEGSDLCDLAAAYFFHLAENQPFVDGNKRAALASALVFPDQNGVAIDDPGELLYQVMLDAAAKTIGKKQIAATLRSLAAPSTARG